MIESLRPAGSGDAIETDLCIIGAGAAGIALAREFAGRGHPRAGGRGRRPAGRRREPGPLSRRVGGPARLRSRLDADALLRRLDQLLGGLLRAALVARSRGAPLGPAQRLADRNRGAGAALSARPGAARPGPLRLYHRGLRGRRRPHAPIRVRQAREPDLAAEPALALRPEVPRRARGCEERPDPAERQRRRAAERSRRDAGDRPPAGRSGRHPRPGSRARLRARHGRHRERAPAAALARQRAAGARATATTWSAASSWNTR